MSLERQVLDHILSPRLAHHPTDSAVGQPLIGATWVDEYPRVCQWHARTRRRLTCGDRGHPRLDHPPAPAPPAHLHLHTCIHACTHLRGPPRPLLLPCGNNTMFPILSQRSLSVSAGRPCSHRCWKHLCVCVHVYVHRVSLFKKSI